MCTTGIIRDGKKMQRISHHCSSKESRGGNAAPGGKSKRGNYKPGAAIVGKETFLGRLWRRLLAGGGRMREHLVLNVRSANTLPLVEGNSARVIASLAILCVCSLHVKGANATWYSGIYDCKGAIISLSSQHLFKPGEVGGLSYALITKIYLIHQNGIYKISCKSSQILTLNTVFFLASHMHFYHPNLSYPSNRNIQN